MLMALNKSPKLISIVNRLSASSGFPSPIAAAILVLPPAARPNPIANMTFTIGYTILIAAMASVLTHFARYIPSTVV